MIAQTAWLVEESYTIDDHPAWRIRCGPWTARLEWEDGPFDVGDRYSPPPTAAFVLRLLEPAPLIDLECRSFPPRAHRKRQRNGVMQCGSGQLSSWRSGAEERAAGTALMARYRSGHTSGRQVWPPTNLNDASDDSILTKALAQSANVWGRSTLRYRQTALIPFSITFRPMSAAFTLNRSNAVMFFSVIPIWDSTPPRC